MRKFKLLTKTLCLSTALLTGSSIMTIASCAKKTETDVSKLFFEVQAGDMTVVFCDRGAAMYSIKYKDTYLTYHPKNKADFLRDDYYHGKVVGRVAGRIKDGKFKIGDKNYEVEVNEISETKHNTLHGGTHGLNTKDFSRQVIEETDAVVVTFNYLSAAGEAGFPEPVDVTIKYKLYKNEAKMDTEITAVNKGTGKTPINITTHPYFRLANEGNILNHTLQINASKVSKFENEATGTNQIVEGERDVTFETEAGVTPFNFTTNNKTIGQDIMAGKRFDYVSGGYDHIWKLNENRDCDMIFTAPADASGKKLSLKVKSSDNINAIIIYANCWPHKGVEVNPSGVDTLYSGITVEPLKWSTRDTISDLYVDANDKFASKITYEFSQN